MGAGRCSRRSSSSSFRLRAAERGVMKGDAFVVSAISMLVFLVAVFVFYPVGSMLVGAFQDFDGSFNPEGFTRNIVDPSIWSLDCVVGGGRCGIAWRTFWLAVMTAGGSTILGLAFALVATRTGFRYKRSLRLLTVLPIITPPFVVGLALTLLFGRSGVITEALSTLIGVEPGRWLYGLTGIWIAQVLSFTAHPSLCDRRRSEGVQPVDGGGLADAEGGPLAHFLAHLAAVMKPGLANAFLTASSQAWPISEIRWCWAAAMAFFRRNFLRRRRLAERTPPARRARPHSPLFHADGLFGAALRLSGKSFATVTGKGEAAATPPCAHVSIAVHALSSPGRSSRSSFTA